VWVPVAPGDARTSLPRYPSPLSALSTLQFSFPPASCSCGSIAAAVTAPLLHNQQKSKPSLSTEGALERLGRAPNETAFREIERPTDRPILRLPMTITRRFAGLLQRRQPRLMTSRCVRLTLVRASCPTKSSGSRIAVLNRPSAN